MPRNEEPTGRYLVLLRKDKPREALATLVQATGLRVLDQQPPIRDLGVAAEIPQHCAIVFDRIGVVLVRCAPEERGLMESAAADFSDSILAVEPERKVYAIAQRREPGIPTPVPAMPRAALDEEDLTWGVRVTGAALSPYSGKGVRIAVLDTGIDLAHPDFQGRNIVSRSFIEEADVQDGNGHGTHCAGIACGPSGPPDAPRYGVAYDAELYVGKVLSDEGGGADGGVLEGINWAIENRCEVISMSLGSPLEAGQPYSRIFEEVARRALDAGTIIIAAAGNDSRRPEHIAPVSHPANCPSILAVAAIDEGLKIAPFSSGGLVTDGGQVDLAAPGVAIFSAWPGAKRYNTLSGTSMATPFAAGVAALHAQAASGARGAGLLARIRDSAQRLNLPARDAGAGLVQAP